MTETLMNLFINDPIKAVTFAALFLVVWFIKGDHKRRADQFAAFEKKMTDWESKIEKQITTSDQCLQKHSADMGNATKAINGDMLKAKESLFELRKSVNEDIDALKVYVSQVQQQLETAFAISTRAVEELKGKFATINETKKIATMLQSKIISIEENTGKQTIRISKFEERLGKVDQALERHRAAFSKTQKENKKEK